MKKILLLAYILCVVALSITNAQCLSGTYTIGGPSPNYTSFTTAVTALVSNGVCGPVTFNVRPGTYSEHFTIPQITGTSYSNTITFTAENGDSSSVLLTFAGTS